MAFRSQVAGGPGRFGEVLSNDPLGDERRLADREGL